MICFLGPKKEDAYIRGRAFTSGNTVKGIKNNLWYAPEHMKTFTLQTSRLNFFPFDNPFNNQKLNFVGITFLSSRIEETLNVFVEMSSDITLF